MARKSFDSDCLSNFVSTVYTTLGVPNEHAALVADSLVQADMWGHPSHGVMRTFWYVSRLQSGATRKVTDPTLLVDAGAIAVLDGNDGVGQIVAKRAMDEAIIRSKKHGIGAVSVRNSGHFGTAMYFTQMAAQQNCLGFLSTNASPAMAPWGGRSKFVGTNPWSIAAPAGNYPPMMLDIANTAVARGKLYIAHKKSEPIPNNWAIDKEGRPTTDAWEGILGNILPLAGHKGYAIATMMDVLSGILSGSAFGDKVIGPYEPRGRSGVGHFALALNISSFRPLEEYYLDIEQYIDSIKSAPKAVGNEEIFYPGELEAKADICNRQQGVTIPEDTLSELDLEAQKLGIISLSKFAN